MIESDLFGVLSAASGITAIVETRIYPVTLPIDPTLPAMTYKIISSVSAPTFSTSGMQRARVEIDCWAGDYANAVNLRAAVIAALDGYEDANFTALQLSQADFFDHDLLHYRAMVEFYLLYTL